jgi:hypothetical protein
MDFGTIIEVPLRDLWPGEATHFTPWLAANLQLVSEKLGLELELESVESAAGDFSADIVATDVATNRRVIIENQYGGTDHRHLGQILTYSSVLNAREVGDTALSCGDDKFMVRHSMDVKFFQIGTIQRTRHNAARSSLSIST